MPHQSPSLAAVPSPTLPPSPPAATPAAPATSSSSSLRRVSRLWSTRLKLPATAPMRVPSSSSSTTESSTTDPAAAAAAAAPPHHTKLQPPATTTPSHTPARRRAGRRLFKRSASTASTPPPTSTTSTTANNNLRPAAPTSSSSSRLSITAPNSTPAAHHPAGVPPTLPRYRFRSPQEFRRHLVEHERSRELLVPSPSDKAPPQTVTFVPIPMDGSCGFNAIARGVNALGVPAKNTAVAGTKFTGDKLRLLLRDQVRENRAFFEEEMGRNPAFKFCVEDVSLEKFAASVVRKGVQGHWLGETYGFVELIAIARALRLRLDIFSYDGKEKQLRRYEEIKEGDLYIGLLYTGPSSGGHFDLLLKKE